MALSDVSDLMGLSWDTVKNMVKPYLEKEARIKLNLRNPGETVVVLSKDTINGVEVIRKGGAEEEEENVESEINNDSEMANYWKWWEYFFQT